MPKRAWLLAALLALPTIARAADPMPRIVHGTLTAEPPTVGVLLENAEDEPDKFGGICTGTLVGCHSFITAAHCVCPTDAEDAATCLAEGTTSPSRLRVFLPNVGILTVASVTIDPDYAFAVGGDAAMIRLTDVVGGVRPMPVNTVGRPPAGTEGIIAGYGTTGGPPFLASDFGVKRDGPVTTSICEEVPNETHICWLYDGTETSSCLGDSGGPLFVDLGTGPLLASVVSGGESFTCEPPDEVFNTDLYVIRDWLAPQLAGDTLDDCDDLPIVQDEGDGAVTTSTSAELGDAKPELGVQLSVPPGTQLLRVALNGQENGGDGFFRVENDFDLYVGAGGDGTEYDCSDTSVGTFAFCEIRSPVPGPWDVLVVRAAGEGVVQLTATLFADDLRGDANCNDELDAGDPLALAAIIAGVATDPCGHADANGDGVVNAADLEPTLAAIFHSN